MDSDLAANVKSLAMGVTQYRSNMTQSNASHVLRHIDILIERLDLPKIDQLFNSQNVMGSQCISEMEKLITDKDTSSHLLCKVLDFFNKLASVHNVCDHLQNSFNLSTVLYAHLAQFGKEEKYCHITPQVIVLLGKLAYRRPISSSTSYIGHVLEFLLDEIDNEESELLQQAMLLLNHLVSHNISIQIQLKSMLTVSRTKHLMQYLKQVSTQRGIQALSILTSVFWKDDIGKKLYRGQNWFKAMKIIFHTIFDERNPEAQISAADLCIELLNHEEVSQQIALYEEEHGCINMLFELLGANTQAASKILELLLKFCSLSMVRRSVCKQSFTNEGNCFKVLLKVAASNVNDLSLPVNNYPSILALTLLREICEETVESSTSPLLGWADDLFSLINSCISNSCHTGDGPTFHFQLHRILKTIQILLCLCSEDETLMNFAEKNLDWSSLESILEYQMTHNLAGISSTQHEWSEIGVHVVMSVLEFMAMAKHLIPIIGKSYFGVLQDVRMVPFFVIALSSLKSYEVQSALRLYQDASSLPDFPVVLLAEKIAEINSKNFSERYSGSLETATFTNLCIKDRSIPVGLMKKSDTAWSGLCGNNTLESISVASVPSSSSSDDKENLDVLATKLHNRANSERKVFGKAAQILDVYEQKIASMKTKESHLQDLLDAKSLALSQADRVIARQRCQQAQLEEESKKLMHLLRDSEIKCEQLAHDIQTMEESRHEIEKELECTVEENRNLQKVAEQYDTLQVAFNNKLHRIEVQERNIATLKQEYDTLTEMHGMFQKHNEKLKIQVNEGVQRLEDLEDEKLKLLKDSGDKQARIHELEGLVMEHEKIARQHLEEKHQQESIKTRLEGKLQKMEEEDKGQKMRILSLERTNKQLEHTLREKGGEIKKLHQCNNCLEERITSMISEKENLCDEISNGKEIIEQLKYKLEEQKATFSKITALSAALQNSQG